MSSTRSQQVFNNSLFLIFRLVLVMIISLYTSRVVINVLGVEDFGIFNVVVGFISIFALISESFGSAFSRFLTVAIAENDKIKQQTVFTASLNILLVFTVVIILLGECFGTLYFAKVANIPFERKSIIQVIFQLALLIFFTNMLKVCCTSMLIAYEKAKIYGIFSIIDSFLKLIIVYLISISPVDKLVSYVFLLLCVSVFSMLMNGVYCKLRFDCFTYKKNVPVAYYKDISFFASWNFLGLISYTFSAQGLTLLINTFAGVLCNAARGIASQVDGASRQFVYSLSIAINPQIIKSYTNHDFQYLRKLLFFSSKCYCFIMLLYAIPISCDTNIILKLWLKTVPEYSVTFVRLTFLSTFFVLMTRPFEVALQATGFLKKIQTITLVLSLLSLIVSWLLLSNGFSVYSVYKLYVLYSFTLLIAQLFCIRIYINISIWEYFKNVFLRVISVMFASLVLPTLVIESFSESIFRLFIVILVSIFSTLFFIITIGFNKVERSVVKNNILKVLKIK